MCVLVSNPLGTSESVSVYENETASQLLFTLTYSDPELAALTLTFTVTPTGPFSFNSGSMYYFKLGK